MSSTLTVPPRGDRKPRSTRLRSIPGGVEFVVTQWPDAAVETAEAVAALGTSRAEGRRAVLDAGLLLLRVAREQGITDITQVGALLATPGCVQVTAPDAWPARTRGGAHRDGGPLPIVRG